MSVSGSDLTKAITKGIRAPGQYLTCYLGDSGMAFIFRLKNSPARQKVCKTCQKPCIFTQIFHSIMHVLSGFFFFFLATFPIYTCTRTKSEFPVLHRQSTETHTTVLGCDQSVCTEMGTCLHVSVPSSASSSHTGRSGAYSVAFHAASTGPTTARKSCFVGTCAANSTMTTLGKNLSEYSLGHKDGSQRKLSPTYGYEF